MLLGCLSYVLQRKIVRKYSWSPPIYVVDDWVHVQRVQVEGEKEHWGRRCICRRDTLNGRIICIASRSPLVVMWLLLICWLLPAWKYSASVFGPATDCTVRDKLAQTDPTFHSQAPGIAVVWRWQLHTQYRAIQNPNHMHRHTIPFNETWFSGLGLEIQQQCTDNK